MEEANVSSIEIANHALESLPIHYSNYIQVQAAGEEVTLLVAIREDFRVRPGADAEPLPVRPLAAIVLSRDHAKRLIDAIQRTLEESELP